MCLHTAVSLLALTLPAQTHPPAVAHPRARRPDVHVIYSEAGGATLLPPPELYLTEIPIIHLTEIPIMHLTEIPIMHLTEIPIMHLTEITIMHLTEIPIVHLTEIKVLNPTEKNSKEKNLYRVLYNFS